MGEPVPHRGGVERRHRVAAAGKTDKLLRGRQFRGRFGHLDRAVVERLELEGAERAVPDQRLGAAEHRNDVLDAARPDVEDHVVFADRRPPRRRARAHARRISAPRRHRPAARSRGFIALALAMISRAVGNEIVFAQRFADRLALRREERIGHAAADDQRLDLVQKVAEQIELGGNLGAADDGRDRMLRRLERLLQRIELGLHGAAGIGGQIGCRHDCRIRGVLAMRDRKGVIDKDVAERREFLGEVLVVLFLAGMEAGVFQTKNVAVFHRGDGGLRLSGRRSPRRRRRAA